MAAVALLEPASVQGEVVLTGPEPRSYDDAAAILSSTLGRRITHRRLSPAAMTARFETFGLPADFAAKLAATNVDNATGSEDRVTDAVLRLTRVAPFDLASFAFRERSVWMPTGE